MQIPFGSRPVVRLIRVSRGVKLFHQRGGVLEPRPVTALEGIEAAIFDRHGRVAQREILRLDGAVRRLDLDLPGSGGRVDAYIAARSLAVWLRGGSPTVTRVRWSVPQGVQTTIELTALAQPGVAEWALTDAEGKSVHERLLETCGQAEVLVLPEGRYTLRAWAFEGDAALRLRVL